MSTLMPGLNESNLWFRADLRPKSEIWPITNDALYRYIDIRMCYHICVYMCRVILKQQQMGPRDFDYSDIKKSTLLGNRGRHIDHFFDSKRNWFPA